MTSMTLYHFPFACSHVTMTALEHAGLAYDDQLINIMKGEQRSPEYLKIHPGGKVPALQVDGRILTENAALLVYIDALKPEAGLLPARDSAWSRGEVASDLVWTSGTIHPAARQMRMPMRYTLNETGEHFDGIRAKGAEYFHPIMALINERTAGGNWWYGEAWSILDVYLSWCCTIAEMARFPIDDYPNVRDLMNRVREGESFQKALARQQATAKAAGIEMLASP